MSNPYREVEIRTASPVRLVAQMYDRALREIRSAREHHAAGRTRPRGLSVSKALAILGALRESLDLERGGEVARNLEALYVFAVDRLVHANMAGDADALASAQQVLEPIHAAWEELAQRPLIER
jgi:flagellar secretion chaperone FliS